jgi:hypothetical protein
MQDKLRFREEERLSFSCYHASDPKNLEQVSQSLSAHRKDILKIQDRVQGPHQPDNQGFTVPAGGNVP